MTAEHVVLFEVRAFGMEVQVEIRDDGREAVDIFGLPGLACVAGKAEMIGLGAIPQPCFKETGWMNFFERDRCFAGDQLRRFSLRIEGPNLPLAARSVPDRVGSENGEGVAMISAGNCFNLLLSHRTFIMARESAPLGAE